MVLGESCLGRVVASFFIYPSPKVDVGVFYYFSLVFTITSTFQRRQDSIRHYSGFRNKIIDLTNLIYSVDTIKEKEYNSLFNKLLELQNDLNNILLNSLNHIESSRKYREQRKNIFIQIINLKNEVLMK